MKLQLSDTKLQITDPKLQLVVEKLVSHFQPKKVYLFGSRANGTATEDSDYDLFLIIEKSDLFASDRVIEAKKLLWGIWTPVDIFIYTEKEFDEWKNEINTIANAVFSEGREIEVGQ